VTSIDERDVVLHGHRLVYRIGGDEPGAERPVLLLIHGLGGSSETWREVLPSFARQYTVIAPDLLGHGESDKPRHDYSLGAHANVLRDLMVAVGIEHATVVGQSLGGGIAMQLAYQHPQRCGRLVLVSSGGLGSEVSWLLRALSLPGVEYLMPVLFPSFVRDVGNALRRRLRGLGLRAPRLEEEWRTYVSLTVPGNRESFVRTLRSVVDPTGQAVSARDRLYLASRVPTLILWGRHDRIIPVAHALAAHEEMPESRLVVFEDSGHFPHAEEPRHFVDVVSDFVDTTRPNRLDEAGWRTLLTAGGNAQLTSA
jgi:pimeloyl-ACP methyl ester carboxylesterase